MAVSTTNTHTVTENEIIRDALFLNGVIDEEETPSAAQITFCRRQLNNMIKFWETEYNLWRYEDITIPLHSSKQSYTIGPSGVKQTARPLRVTQFRSVENSTGYEIPRRVVSLTEYKKQPLKTSTGSPVQVSYDPQLTNGVAYFWPVQNDSLTSLSDGSTDLWTDSGTVPGEYYYTGSDLASEPTYVFANEVELTEGTLGSLANGEWAYGDNDTLGADTLYVKLAIGDPDAQASGYVKATTSTLKKAILTVQRPLFVFTQSSNNPDYPSEWYETLTYNLAIRISAAPGYGPATQAVVALAATSFEKVKNWDSEYTSIFIEPRMR